MLSWNRFWRLSPSRIRTTSCCSLAPALTSSSRSSTAGPAGGGVVRLCSLVVPAVVRLCSGVVVLRPSGVVVLRPSGVVVAVVLRPSGVVVPCPVVLLPSGVVVAVLRPSDVVVTTGMGRGVVTS